MNWYILFSLKLKEEKLCKNINKRKGVYAYIPQLEYYRRDIKECAFKPLFPGYIFVKTYLNQLEFDELIMKMDQEKDGLIRQLKYKETTALTQDEILLLNKLLSSSCVLKMSYGFLNESKAIVSEGPLKGLESHIVKVDYHNKIAYLDIQFMNRTIQAGLSIEK